jgi:hypothetical protein
MKTIINMSILKFLGLKKKDEVVNIKAVKQETDYGSFIKGNDSSKKKKKTMIPWNSDEGREMLTHSKYNAAFFDLAHTYQNMRNPFYASVASMVNVLNALRLDKGIIPDNKERSVQFFDRNTGEIREYNFNMYTQNTLLDSETDKIKDREKIAPSLNDEVVYVDFEEFNPGLSLIQVKKILEIYRCKVDMFYANNNMRGFLENFREVLKKSLSIGDKFIIVNYYGDIIGLQQAGHFSVVAAYDDKSDKVLILDCAAHKNPWYWLDLTKLYEAMNTEAREGNKRGYIVVEEAFEV